jgi:hypothetical protein
VSPWFGVWWWEERNVFTGAGKVGIQAVHAEMLDENITFVKPSVPV